MLAHGVGGINIDATRIKSESIPMVWEKPRGGIWTTDVEAKGKLVEDKLGRFPTNMILGGLPQLDGENSPIVVARKPIEGTVAENVLKNSAGGINIDGARIEHNDPTITRKDMDSDTGDIFTGIGRSSTEAGPDSKGRFPSNIILGHSPGCVKVGSKRVKTSSGKRGSDKNIGKEQGLFGIKANGEEVGYADADGKEAVDSWQCEDDCPISNLDNQSGTSKSAKQPTKGRSKNAPPSQIYGGGKGMAPRMGQVCPEYGDEGGASRYFKQVHAIEDWPGPDEVVVEEEE